jgi:hypothetical protein
MKRAARTREEDLAYVGRSGPRFAHRLVWLYVHGRHPTREIDHVNGNPTDDRIANLRQCSGLPN